MSEVPLYTRFKHQQEDAAGRAGDVPRDRAGDDGRRARDGESDEDLLER